MSSPLDVLILDDEPHICRALDRVLSRRHRVRYATTPGEALAAAEVRAPDVVVSDYQLADCTSVEFLRVVKTRWPTTRCVLHSATLPSRHRTQLLDEGVVDRVVEKPASNEDILACLDFT